jgi:hypothetical protein
VEESNGRENYAHTLAVEDILLAYSHFHKEKKKVDFLGFFLKKEKVNRLDLKNKSGVDRLQKHAFPHKCLKQYNLFQKKTFHDGLFA